MTLIVAGEIHRWMLKLVDKNLRRKGLKVPPPKYLSVTKGKTVTFCQTLLQPGGQG